MSKFDARKSLDLWKRREAYRKQRHTYWARKGKGHVKQRDLWKARLYEARAMVARRDRQIAGDTPRFRTAAQIGLKFTDTRGPKGAVTKGGGHHSAGAKSKTLANLIAQARVFHRGHKDKGGGGLAYEALVNDRGDIVFGNPVWRKSDGIARTNTGLVNICVPGTTGDRMTPECMKSIRWLMDNWHTDKVPAPHRLPRPARALVWKGHREWFPNSECPGTMLADYKRVWS